MESVNVIKEGDSKALLSSYLRCVLRVQCMGDYVLGSSINVYANGPLS